MFHFLRKLIIGTFVLGWAGICTALYFFPTLTPTPIADRVIAREEEKEQFRIAAEEAKKVIYRFDARVLEPIDGQSLAIRANDGITRGLILAGLKVPASMQVDNRRYLLQLLRNKDVTIEISFLTPQRVGVGFIFLGETNVNLQMIESGRAGVHFASLEKLRRHHVPRLMQAQKNACRDGVGLWDVRHPDAQVRHP